MMTIYYIRVGFTIKLSVIGLFEYLILDNNFSQYWNTTDIQIQDLLIMIYYSTAHNRTPRVLDTRQTIYTILEHYWCPDTRSTNTMIYYSTVRNRTPRVLDTRQTIYTILEHYWCPDTRSTNTMIYYSTVHNRTPRVLDTHNHFTQKMNHHSHRSIPHSNLTHQENVSLTERQHTCHHLSFSTLKTRKYTYDNYNTVVSIKHSSLHGVTPRTVEWLV